MKEHSCRDSEQIILEIYDEEFENFQPEPFTSDEEGNVTGMALCKTRCVTCGEIYLVEVPLLKFAEDEGLEEELDENEEGESDE